MSKKIILEVSVPDYIADGYDQHVTHRTEVGTPVFSVDLTEPSETEAFQCRIGIIRTVALSIHQRIILDAKMSGDIDNYFP